ncbi:MAG: AMP-binding protein [Bacteriovoracaceae bacterium]
MKDYCWFKEYPEGVPQEIDPNEFGSLVEILERSFKEYAQKPAFYNLKTTMSFAQIDEQSKKFASYLQNNLGLKKGDRLALMMPNILQYPIALFGALRAGVVVVNVNPLYTSRELEHQLNDSGAKAIVIYANSAHTLEACIHNTHVKHVIVTEIAELAKFPLNHVINFTLKHVKKMVPSWNIPLAISFKQALMMGDDDKYERPHIGHDDIAFLQYTGGTTGVSKGAVLTHGNIVCNMLQAKAWLGPLLEEHGEDALSEEIIITPLPLYHIFSLTANCFIFFAIGALNVLITNPRDTERFIGEMKKFKFTAFTGVNTLFNSLVNHENFKECDFSRLRATLGGGMAVQKAVAEKWKEVTGRPLIEAYGLTETSPAACVNPISLDNYNGKIGLPIPSTVVEIRDDQGKELEVGEVGEICIKGPQVMQGYWNRPEETAKVMTPDGFLKTGDMGFMDEKGYFQIVDRKKDMILVSGFNVYPNEIEDVIATHPKVFECAAIGIPDEKSGEVVKLFVVKKEEDLTDQELFNFSKENLTGYKRPKYIEFRKDLPKSNVGKILRKDLRE